MPTKNEDHGLAHKRTCYESLDKTYTYSCPHQNSSYPGFSNGINCLCASAMDRSTMDVSMATGKKWPVCKGKISGWK